MRWRSSGCTERLKWLHGSEAATLWQKKRGGARIHAHRPLLLCFAASPVKRSPMPRHHHHVYVVELSRQVLSEARFVKANPDYLGDKPCVYVGMTGQSPDVRFDKHKAGLKSNRFVREYGLRLMPELYECFNPMPYEAAREMEVELAIGLREEGYAVWQA